MGYRFRFVFLYVFCVGVSLLYVGMQISEMARDTDYRYYVEFAEYAFEPRAEFSESARIEGGTSLVQTGNDGAYGIHAGIHFEPVKYVTPILQHLFGPWGIHVWYILCMYVPLLYVFWRERRGDVTQTLRVTALLYAAAPAALAVLGEGIRPFTILYPALFLFLTSIIEDRNVSERLMFLNLIAAVREEGILFAVVGVVYLTLNSLVEGRGGRTLVPLYAAISGWVVAYVSYVLWLSSWFEWRSFSGVQAILSDVTYAPLLFLALGITLLLLHYRNILLQFMPYFPKVFLTFALLMPVIGALFVGIATASVEGVLFSRYGMLVVVLGCALLALWLTRKPHATSPVS